MIKAIISRTYRNDETMGMFQVVDGMKLLYRCKCLELADNGNQHDISCVPEGVYDVVKEKNEKGDVFRVLNVPDRSGILIHKGNFKRDTKGCIIPGTFFCDLDLDQIPDVGESTKAMDMLNEVLPSKFKLYII